MSDVRAPSETTLVRGLLIVAVAGLVASPILDRVFYDCRQLATGNRDAFWTLRIVGSIFPWMIVAMVIVRLDPSRAARRRALILLLAIAASLGTSICVKLVVRRLRPEFRAEAVAKDPTHRTYADYAYTWFEFRPWSDRPLYTGGLSFPSEHAAAAFAGALILSFYYPRAAPIWLAWAAGCAFTRVAIRAHYASDTMGSLLVAVAVSSAIYRALAPRWLAPRARALPNEEGATDGR